MSLTKKTIVSLAVLFFSCISVSGQQKTSGDHVQAIERNDIDNTPTSITFSATANYGKGSASEIFETYFEGIGANSRFVLANTTVTKQGITVEKYQQYYNDIKVERAAYAVMYNRDGIATFMNGNYYNVNYAPSMNPQLGERVAKDIAIASVNAEEYAWQIDGLEKQLKAEKKDQAATYYPSGELVWIEDHYLQAPDRKLHLAYGFNVYAIRPLSREMIYVDAVSGKILFRNSMLHHTNGTGASMYSGTLSFKTSMYSGIRYLEETTRGGGINTYSCANTNGSTILDVSSASSTFASDIALDAHWGAEKVYDYWLNEQGRNSFNNAGAAINSFVHFQVGYDNAFWNGSQMVYGDGSGLPSGFSPLAALDVCAHEIGHAVCQYTANLAYNLESGAMNEGFSDIWGAIIEEYADPHESDAVAKNMWKIGEEISTSSLRRMDNPNLRGQPDTYGGSGWVSVVGCTPTSGNDYCGVHTNSGVLNYWFYLLCQGGSGTNDISSVYSVTGVGTAKGADIAYQTELLLSSGSTFANCRTASISAATTLYGPCSAEVAAVTKAWYAVGVGANYTPGGAAAIGGTGTVCISATTSLTNATSGGTWTSANTSVATVGSASGVVTGVAAGTANISYATTGGCTVTKIVTVSTTPTVNVISGTTSLCQSATTTLTNATTGGTWTSSVTAKATIGSTSGLVTGVSAGTTIISYTKSNGCGSVAATTNFTVYATPAAIGGTATVCVGDNTTLTNPVSGGTWTSGSISVATVGSATGIVAGAAAGTAVITYTMPGSCFVTKTVTVSMTPTVDVISGATSICQSATTTLTNASTGGTWTSSVTAKATVGSSTGLVTGVSAGTTVISYTKTTGCGSVSATTNFTVYATPAVIGGTATVCVGNNTTLTNSVSGGDWTSGNTAVATVGSGTGMVTGAAAGTAVITYTMPGACIATKTVTVSVTPTVDVISGSTTVCQSATTTLTNASTGGTWSSSVTAKATIGSTSGLVTGVSAGTTVISYTKTNGCGSVSTTTNFTVSATPVAIGGTAMVCVGNNTTLTNSVSGGAWTSGNTSVATVGSSTGTVTGVGAGTAVITYTMPGSCFVTKIATVSITPTVNVITGTTTLCQFASTTLANATGGGVWSSGNTSVATIGSSDGIVNAVGAGSANISYTVTNGCASVSATTSILVDAGPSVIGGLASLCAGGTTVLSNSVSGGTWSSDNMPVATVDAGGTVAGVSNGTANITYVVASGCYSTKQVTVGAITVSAGANVAICVGSSTGLTATGAATYVWSPATDLSASTGASVTASPTITTTYTVTGTTGGCSNVATVTVSVNSMASASTGQSFVCVGGSMPLANATGGGTWSSSNTGLATVGSATGVVTGVGSGVVGISYILPTGCYSVKMVTVTAMASITSSTPYVCLGTTGIFSHPMPGGTWASAVPYCASIDGTTGVVTGAHVGVTNITYTAGIGCVKTTTVQVMNITMNITGSSAVCPGSTSTLSNLTTGGVWMVDSASIATINGSTGVLMGVAPGTANVTYTVGECRTYRVATVNVLPDTIVAPITVLCAGSSTTFTNATGGGAWSSSNTAKATVGTSSGLVTAVGAGTATISYTIGTGCYRTKAVTVGAMPAAITGTMAMCQGGSVTLSCATSGGTWSSGDTGTASIASSTGTTAVITGVGAGTADISYNHSGGCVRTATVTVNAAVASNSGIASICVSGTTTLSNATGGGTWSSSVTAKATVGSLSGIVTGVAAGTSNITYRTSATCFAVTQVTVSTATAISGSAAACIGLTTALTHGISGGTWNSSNSSVATVDATTGVVTGVAAGAVTITYLVSPGCFAVKSMMVYNLPASISGTPTVCVGAVRTLTSGGGTGTWSSSDGAVATVHPTLGQVTGVSEGIVTITYRITATGCYTTREVTVNATPGAIVGSTPVCAGSATTYTNPLSGGVWSSTSATVMTIDSTSGNAAAIAGGGTTIRYTMPTGCMVTKAVTVSAIPVAIGGTFVICAGNTTVLTSATAGATWTSADSSIATITATTSTSCTVMGINSGIVAINYTNANGCSRSANVTVNAALPASTGANIVCVGNMATLSNSITGGTWASSVTAKATVGVSTGIVTGVAIGTSNITYSVGAGCKSITQVTVNAATAALGGATSVCAGQSTTFTSADAGGSWSSANESIATVNSSGVVTGAAAGTTTITYAVSAGCYKTKSITVKAVPSISGLSTLPVATSTVLTGSPTGGTWASSATGTASVGATTGNVTGIDAGSVTITYTATGCYATWDMYIYSIGGKPGMTGFTSTAPTFSVYPNPTSGALSVNAGVDGTFAIYTLDGRQLKEYAVSGGTTSVQLPQGMAAGVYTCRFNGTDGSTHVVRLVFEQ